MRVEVTHVSGAMIPKIMIEFLQRLREIMITATIHNVQSFACVSVIETQTVFGRERRGFCDVPQRS